jgi:hypothetical protein
LQIPGLDHSRHQADLRLPAAGLFAPSLAMPFAHVLASGERRLGLIATKSHLVFGRHRVHGSDAEYDQFQSSVFILIGIQMTRLAFMKERSQLAGEFTAFENVCWLNLLVVWQAIV